MKPNDIKNQCWEQAKKAFGLDRELMSEMDELRVNNVATLAFYEIMNNEYFKGRYSSFRIGLDPQGSSKLMIFHPNLNNLKNVVGGIAEMPTLYSLSSSSPKTLVEKETPIPFATDQEKAELEHLKDVLAQKNDIKDIVNYFENNEKEFYSLMLLTEGGRKKEKSGFLPTQELGTTLSQLVSVADSNLAEQYKTYFDCCESLPLAERFYNSLETTVFPQFNAVMDLNDKEQVKEALCDWNTVSQHKFLNLFTSDGNNKSAKAIINPDNYKDDSLTGFLEGNLKEKRRQMIEKINTIPSFFENTLISIIVNKNHDEVKRTLYNNLLLEKEKKEFINNIDVLIETTSLDAHYERYKHEVEGVVESIKNTYSCLNGNKAVDDVKFKIDERDGGQSRYNVFDYLMEMDKMAFDTSIDKQYALKEMAFDGESAPGNYLNEIFITATNGVENVAIGHFMSQRPDIMTDDREWEFSCDLADIVKDNQSLISQLVENSMEVAQSKQIVFDYMAPDQSLLFQEMQKALKTREDVFGVVVADNMALEDKWFFKGLSQLKKTYENEGSFANEYELSYNDLLGLKKQFQQWFDDNVDKFKDLMKNRPSLCNSDEDNDFDIVHDIKQQVKSLEKEHFQSKNKSRIKPN